MRPVLVWFAILALAVNAGGVSTAALPGKLPPSLPLDLSHPEAVSWTPLAVVQVDTGADRSESLAFAAPGGYGPSYVLKAPADGMVEYLYPWSGYFSLAQPIVRLYDPKLLDDLARARAAAGRFDVRSLVVATATPRPATPANFPAPTMAPQRAALAPDPPPAAIAGVTPRARPSLELVAPPTAPARSDALTQARARVTQAEQRLSDLQQERADRRQLQQAGVLAEEEMARFDAELRQAEVEVRLARHNLQQAEASQPQSPAPAAAPDVARSGPATLRSALPAFPTPSVDLQRLAVPRWQDVLAPTGGLVLKPLQAPGTVVKKGAPLLLVGNTAWVRVRALVGAGLGGPLEVAAPVSVRFPALAGLDFTGWVTLKQKNPGDERLILEMLLTYPAEPAATYNVLCNLANSGPTVKSLDEVELAPKATRLSERAPTEMFLGVVPTQLLAATSPTETSPALAGRLAVMPSLPRFGPARGGDERLRQRLAQVHEWQSSFLDGMTTVLYNQRVVLSYPREGEIAGAVERMLKGQVEHDPGYCARTLRLALGWGLGDAYQWALQLPGRGFAARADGLPRPGDILVWPFTYGRNRSQHIGVAVRQGDRIMLLSNLEGTLGTSEIPGGYLAFYQPRDEQQAARP